jgi:hypothetical protein
LDQDHIRTFRNELGCKGGQTLVGTLCHSRLEKHEVAAFRPTELFQLGSKRAEQEVARRTVESGEISNAG